MYVTSSTNRLVTDDLSVDDIRLVNFSTGAPRCQAAVGGQVAGRERTPAGSGAALAPSESRWSLTAAETLGTRTTL